MTRIAPSTFPKTEVFGTLLDLMIYRARIPPTSGIIEQAGARAVGGMTMIKKALFEELIIHVDKEELARLLEIEPGFTVQQIEEQGQEFRLIFSRTTDLNEKIPRREVRRGFLE
jgi:hypothetical protein